MSRYIDRAVQEELATHTPRRTITAYRGYDTRHRAVNTTYGAYFSDDPQIAAAYARAHGVCGEVTAHVLDLNRALDWTTETSADFQAHVIRWRERRRNPLGTRAALAQFNRGAQSDVTLAEAVGYLLRCPPRRVGHDELDPLGGYVRAYLREQGCDALVRPHEGGGGVRDGTTEYVVFSPTRIKPRAATRR